MKEKTWFCLRQSFGKKIAKGWTRLSNQVSLCSCPFILFLGHQLFAAVKGKKTAYIDLWYIVVQSL